MICKECYSDNDHITPLLNPKHCLNEHTQYICSTCGRCICIEKDPVRGLMRWQFPFKSLEIAKLYLIAAEATTNTACGIYELVDNKGRTSYKIFVSRSELESYLSKHKEKRCLTMKPVFQIENYQPTTKMQLRKLSETEVAAYLEKQTRQK